MLRWIVLGTALTLGCSQYSSPHVEARSIHGAPSGVTSFSVLKLGNGGLVTRLKLASDGTKTAAGDSTGGWVWSVAQNQWIDTLNTVSMPAGTFTQDNSNGADELIFDPTTTSTLWMSFGGDIYKSTNSGVNWLATTGYTHQPVHTSGNTNTSSLTPYGAIDPNNSAIVYFSSPNGGVFRSTNGTAAAASVTFSKLSTLGAGLPLRSSGVLVFPKATTSATSVNLATAVGTTVTLAKARATVSGTFTTASTTLTLTTNVPSNGGGEFGTIAYDVWDVTANAKIGIVCGGYGTTTLQLCALSTATGSVAFSANPSAGNTLTLNGTTVTFVASGATGNQVNIGGSLATTLANLLAFLQGSADVQLVKFTYSVPAANNALNLSAATSGGAGNALTLAKVGAVMTLSGATLTGGANSYINSTGAADIIAFSYPRLADNTGPSIQVWQTSNPLNQFYGSVTGNQNDGANVVITVNSVVGSGTITDWSVGFAGADGIGGGHRIVFDTFGGTTASCAGGLSLCTKNVYLHTYGYGTFKSVDGGQTWALLTETGAPDAVFHMTISPNGTLWVQNYTYPASTHNVQKYVPGTPGVWTEQITGNSFTSAGISVDPLNCATEATCHVAVAANDGSIWYSINAGAASPTWLQSGTRTYSSTSDVLWVTPDLTPLFNNFFAGTTLAFDPASSGTLYRGGEGVWRTANPPTSSLAAITWSQQTRGIEMFILNQVLSPVGASGSAFITTWDVPCFYSESFATYPAASSCYDAGTYIALAKSYSSDWFPQGSGTPGVVALVNNGDSSNILSNDTSGYSLDKGKPSPSTWTRMSAYTAGASWANAAATLTLSVPVHASILAGWSIYDLDTRSKIGVVASKAGSTITLAAGAANASSGAADRLAIEPFDRTGGCVAASTNGTVMVRFNQYTGSNVPYISTDTGQTWAAITLPAGWTPAGWGNSDNFLSYTKFCDSNKVNGDIYIYSPWGTTALYRYNAATTAWTYQSSPNFSDAFRNGQMKTVYNNTTDIFFTAGQCAAPHNCPHNFSFSHDQGVTWNVIPNFLEVGAFALGKEAPGKSYPTIYASGYYSGVPGIWRCTDWVPTNVASCAWTNIGYQPNGSASNLIDMDGDKAIYGQFYGVNGKQAFKGSLN